jgi:hypothetical protein
MVLHLTRACARLSGVRRRATLAVFACLFAGTGRAATRAFAETYETSTGSQGDAQIESWVDDDHAFQDWDVWRLWWGGSASITDSVELSAYVIAAQQEGSNDAMGSGLQLEMLYLMARWRFLGDGARGFSLMAQLEFCLPFESSNQDQGNSDYLSHATVLGERLVASYDLPHFRFSANALVDEAAVLDLSANYDVLVGFKWAAGAAWAPWVGARGPPFTLGLEAFGDIPAETFQDSGLWAVWWPGGFPVAAGPAVSFASGRFWATASWGLAPPGAYVDPGSYFASRGFNQWTGREGIGRLIFAFEF